MKTKKMSKSQREFRKLFPKYVVGDTVQRKNSDYVFPGTVVAVFNKLGGQLRYVVEDDRGTLFIQSDKTLKRRKA